MLRLIFGFSFSYETAKFLQAKTCGILCGRQFALSLIFDFSLAYETAKFFAGKNLRAFMG